MQMTYILFPPDVSVPSNTTTPNRLTREDGETFLSTFKATDALLSAVTAAE